MAQRTLDELTAIGAADAYLAVVATVRADGTVQSSLVNAGVLEHPVAGRPVVAFVTYGPVKLANLRARPHATLTFRAGWRWAAVDGPVEIVGPDDEMPGVDAEALRLLLRAVFTAAGGTHDDWDGYDAAMARERRAAVLLTPERIYGS